MKYILFVITALLFSNGLFAQQMTRAEYNNRLDSLTVLKNRLKEQKQSLKSEIDKLTKLSEELDNKLKECLPAFFIKKYGKEIGRRVAAGRVWVGMTEEMLRDSYGKPDKVETNKEKWGVFSQYYYGKIIFFFRDGKLIEWEEKE